MQSDKTIFYDLILQLEILYIEIDPFLNNIVVYDETIYNFLKSLKIETYKLKNIKQDYDEIKTLSNYFLQLFAGLGYEKTNRRVDIFEEMTNKL